MGRGLELNKLRASNTRAMAGRATTALILGGAGYGNSRLAAEVASEIEDAGGLVVRSHGVELAGGELPFAGLAEVVRGLIRARGQDEMTQVLHRHGDVLMPLHPGGNPASAVNVGRASLVTAAVSLIEELALETHLCWLIEDMPWLDQATRDVAGAGRQAADPGHSAHYRGRTSPAGPDPLDRDARCYAIHLQPLARDEVSALVFAAVEHLSSQAADVGAVGVRQRSDEGVAHGRQGAASDAVRRRLLSVAGRRATRSPAPASGLRRRGR